MISENRLVNYSLLHLLSRHRDLQIQDIYPGLDACTQKSLLAKHHDLVIISLAPYRPDALELLAHLQDITARIPLLILSNGADRHLLRNFIRGGCKGYLEKDATAEDFMQAVIDVCAGRHYLPGRLEPAHLLHGTPLPHDQLSRRELQVFLKLIQCKPIVMVARELDVSPSAVSVFRNRVLKKLNSRSNADFIFYALQHHLLRVPTHQH